jgi:hypothetical protein
MPGLKDMMNQQLARVFPVRRGLGRKTAFKTA